MKKTQPQCVAKNLRATLISKSRRRQSGFTILEVMVVLTLLAVAAAFVGPAIFERLDEGNIKAAQIQIRNLKNSVLDYKRVCHSLPPNLEALIEKPSEGKDCKRYPASGFLSEGKLPNDPWDNPYFYELEGRKFIIYSLGADGIEGGEGVDADIRSDQLN